MKAKQLLQYEREGVELKQYAKGAVIFGATGLIGTSCLHYLLHYEAYDKVISIGRRALPVYHPKLTHYTVKKPKVQNLPGFLTYIKTNSCTLA